MATATAVAKPFGMVPGSYMDLAVLLEPFAGPLCMQLFLAGLFAAAWTSGLAWWLCGAYALLDLFNLPVDFRSRPMRICIALFFIPSTGMLFLHINPVLQIILFAGLLSVVFPVIGLALVWRISQPDMGYFRWSVRSWRGIRIIVLDVYAVALSLVIGWVSLPEALNQLTDFVKAF
jgi:Mn2+/Fe2+ NRAMP family transporter